MPLPSSTRGAEENVYKKFRKEGIFLRSSPAGAHTSVGAYNPGGSRALPLSEATPAYTLLATSVDPVWFRITGFTEADVRAQLNVPLRDVGVIVDAFGGKAHLRDILQGGVTEFTRATSNGPITLGKWLAAKGTVNINCGGDNTVTAKFTFAI